MDNYILSKGFVFSIVFEGNYILITRYLEEETYPLIKKLKVSFYGYSPHPESSLVKSAEVIKEVKEARWNRSTRVIEARYMVKPAAEDTVNSDSAAKPELANTEEELVSFPRRFGFAYAFIVASLRL